MIGELLEFAGVAEAGIGLMLVLAVLYWRKFTMILAMVGAKMTVIVFSIGLIGFLALTGIVDLNPDVALELLKTIWDVAWSLYEVFG